MITFMLIFIVGTILLFVPVLSGYRKHVGAQHHIDLMAGDEGEE